MMFATGLNCMVNWNLLKIGGDAMQEAIDAFERMCSVPQQHRPGNGVYMTNEQKPYGWYACAEGGTGGEQKPYGWYACAEGAQNTCSSAYTTKGKGDNIYVNYNFRKPSPDKAGIR